ncbi:hypothetical protein [Meiothermus sp.]|uniref:variant leucine-rich repeat-containing protein n=1 Tax=Meiothermus sp. TaxID=1955249 RepID=UPI00307E1E21
MTLLLEEAQNPQTAPERLRALASTRSPEVRRAVARNPNTPEDVLLRLAVHFPEEVLGNPLIDLLLLVNPNWLAEIPGYARNRLLGHPQTPPHFLRWAAREGDPVALLALLQNPSAPPELVEPLTNHGLPAVAEAARLHGALETSPLERALWWSEADMDYLELRQMVLLGLAPAWIAPRIAGEPDTGLRLALLEQAHLPKEVLAAFLFDEDEAVRRAARQHPSTPPEAAELLDRLEGQLPVEIPIEALAQGTIPVGTGSGPYTQGTIPVGTGSGPYTQGTIPFGTAAPPQYTPGTIPFGTGGSPYTQSHYWMRQLLAQHPQTPPHLLERFLTDDDWRVRGALARNPALPAHWLLQLAQDGDREVRQWAATHPRTPSAALERLACDEYEEVRKAAAANPSAPRRVLELFERAQAQDAALTAEELERMARLGEWARRLAVAHPNTPSETLERCKGDPDWHTRLAVARNPKTPPATLAAMAGDSDPDVRQAVAVHRHTPLESLEGLARDEQPDVRAQVAQNPRTPPNLLQLLAQDDHWRVRQAVAANLSTPPQVLEQLAQDPDRDVRQAVADNPQVPETALEPLFAGWFAKLEAPMSLVELYRRARNLEALGPELLDKLAQGSDWAMRLAARHPCTPPETLRTLAQDEDWRVRQAVATHPVPPPELLSLLAGDPDADVRRAVAAHPQVTGEILERLCADEQQDIRLQAAKHPGAPPLALAILLADADETVRQAAQAHPRAPAELVELYRRAEALDPSLEGAFLQRLAGQTLWSRGLAAQNPSTPPEALHELIRDSEWSVRQAAAKNPALTPKMLAVLAQDTDRDVRQAVAQHPRTPAATLAELLRDVDENVRLSALRNPNLEPASLERYRAQLVLQGSRSRFTLNRAVALSRPEIPPHELAKVRHWAAPEWMVRYAVAQNPHTPRPILERLAQDANRLVRAAAARRLAQGESTGAG